MRIKRPRERAPAIRRRGGEGAEAVEREGWMCVRGKEGRGERLTDRADRGAYVVERKFRKESFFHPRCSYAPLEIWRSQRSSSTRVFQTDLKLCSRTARTRIANASLWVMRYTGRFSRVFTEGEKRRGEGHCLSCLLRSRWETFPGYRIRCTVLRSLRRRKLRWKCIPSTPLEKSKLLNSLIF